MGAVEAAQLQGAQAQITTAINLLKAAGSTCQGAQDPIMQGFSGMLNSALEVLQGGFDQLFQTAIPLAEAAG